MDIHDRRAIFVYEATRLAAVAAKAPIVPAHWEDRDIAFQNQFVKVVERQCGPNRMTDPKAIHDNWAQSYYDIGWVYGEKYDPSSKQHPDLVPYEELGRVEREKDEVFYAVCEIARTLIYD